MKALLENQFLHFQVFQLFVSEFLLFLLNFNSLPMQFINFKNGSEISILTVLGRVFRGLLLLGGAFVALRSSPAVFSS